MCRPWEGFSRAQTPLARGARSGGGAEVRGPAPWSCGDGGHYVRAAGWVRGRQAFGGLIPKSRHPPSRHPPSGGFAVVSCAGSLTFSASFQASGRKGLQCVRGGDTQGRKEPLCLHGLAGQRLRRGQGAREPQQPPPPGCRSSPLRPLGAGLSRAGSQCRWSRQREGARRTGILWSQLFVSN